jgi:hypothetical protein
MNPSHHGRDEQVFGAKQQFCTGQGGLRSRFANERRVPGVKDGWCFAFAAPENFTRTARPSCSELPIRGKPGMNPSHHGRDEQMFGAK